VKPSRYQATGDPNDELLDDLPSGDDVGHKSYHIQERFSTLQPRADGGGAGFGSGAPAIAGAAKSPGRRADAGVLRMTELKLEDYYSSADKTRDAAAISLFFDKSRKYKMHLDGVRMIDQFVRPNQMTRWALTKKTKKLRESCVQ
jgi:hypothetical protein